MFFDRILVKRKEDIRYGLTEISFQRTQAQIMKLLKDHGCDRTGFLSNGDEHVLVFELDEKPYEIHIPRVFIRDQYNDRLGIRIVFRYLETLLELVKHRIIDFEFLMMGTKIVEHDGVRRLLGEVVKEIPTPELLSGITTDGCKPVPRLEDE